MIREQFIRTNSLAWLPYLQHFADSKNTNKDESTRQTPLTLMKSYFQHNLNPIEAVAQKVRKRKEEQFEKYSKQESFAVGDMVRVKMTSIQSALRKKVKEGLKKLIVVRFSPTIYSISKIFPVPPGKLGFPSYLIEDSQGNLVRNISGTPKKFNSGELLKIGQETPKKHPVDLERANFLNRVRAQDLNVESPEQQQQQQEEESRQQQQQQERQHQRQAEKPITKFGSKDWTRILKGKEFQDFDHIPSIILKVVYDRSYKEYIVDYRNNAGIFQATLGDILELAKDEPWFQPEWLR